MRKPLLVLSKAPIQTNKNAQTFADATRYQEIRFIKYKLRLKAIAKSTFIIRLFEVNFSDVPLLLAHNGFIMSN